MSEKFTPGPWFGGWEWDEDWDNFDFGIVAANRGEICKISDRRENSHVCANSPMDETMANAKLISAAPDLYDALKELVAHCESHGIRFLSANAALRKARGE